MRERNWMVVMPLVVILVALSATSGTGQQILQVRKPGLVSLSDEFRSDPQNLSFRTHFGKILPILLTDTSAWMVAYPDQSSDPEFGGEFFNIYSSTLPVAVDRSGSQSRVLSLIGNDLSAFSASGTDTVNLTIHIEKDLEYYQGEGSYTNWTERTPGEGWVWRYLNKGNSFGIPLPVSVKGFTGPVILKSKARGVSRDTGATPDHLLTMTFQSQVSDISFTGYSFAEVKDTVTVNPSSSLTLTLKSTGFSATKVDRIYIDWVEASGKWVGVLDTNFLRFKAPDRPLQQGFLVLKAGIRTNYLLIDENSGLVVPAAAVDSSATEKRIVFNTNQFTGSDWILTDINQLTTILSERSVESTVTGSESMILISPPEFLGFATDYASFRQQTGGINSRVVSSTDIFYTWSEGNPEPHAIKDFLFNEYQQNPNLKYVLLIGNTSWDSREITAKFGRKNFLPTYGNPVSDQWMVSFSDTNRVYTYLTIGRLPIISEEEGFQFLDKLSVYLDQRKNHPNIKEFGFINGGFDQNEIRIFFNQTTRLINDFVYDPTIAGTIDTVIKRTEGYQDAGRETPKIQRMFKEGVGFVNFIGHAGSRTWDLMLSDVRSLPAQTPLFPFVTSMTCFTGDIANPNQDSFAEEFVLIPDRGAIGFMGTSGLGYIDLDDLLVRNIYTELFRNNRIAFADGITHGKNALAIRYKTNDRVRSIIRQYVYIGDPSLEMPVRQFPDLAIGVNSTALKLNDTTVVLNYSLNNFGKNATDSIRVTLEGLPAGLQSQKTVSLSGSVLQVYDTVYISLPGSYQLSATADWLTLQDAEKENNSIEFNVIIPQTKVTFYNLVSGQYLKPEMKTVWIYSPEEFELKINLKKANGVTVQSLARTISGLDSVVFDFSGFSESIAAIEYSTDDFKTSKSFEVFISSTDFPTTVYRPETILLSDGMAISGSDIKFEGKNQLVAIGSSGFDGINTAYVTSGEETIFGQFRGIVAARLDSVDLKILESKEFDTYLDSANTKLLEQWILDRLVTNDYLAFAIKDEGSRRLTPSFKTFLRNMGSQYIDSVKNRQGWAFLLKLGKTPRRILEGWASSSLLTVYQETMLPAFQKSGNVRIPFRQQKVFKNIEVANSSADSVFVLNKDTKEFDLLTKGNHVFNGTEMDTLNILLKNTGTNSDIRLTAGNASYIQNSPSGLLSMVIPEQPLIVGQPFTIHGLAFNSYPDPSGQVKINFSMEIDNSVAFSVDSLFSKSAYRVPFQFSVPPRTLTDTGNYLLSFSVIDSDVINEFSKLTDTLSVVIGTGVESFNPDIRAFLKERELISGERPLVGKTAGFEIRILYNDFLLLDDTSKISVQFNGFPVPFGTTMEVIDSPEQKETKIKLTEEFVPGINTLTISVQPPFGEFSVDPKTESFQVFVDESSGIRQYANYPNPFADETRFYFELGGLEDPTGGEIHIYTVNGLKIKEIDIQRPVIGDNAVYWDGTDTDGDEIANGVYLYRVSFSFKDKTIYKTGKLMRYQ